MSSKQFTRRTFLGSAGALAASALAADRKGHRPNILFVAADDMNTSLGCYGHPIVKTPNVDRVAARGIRFDRAYCQFPLCGPSRASLLTGLRPDTTKVLGNNVDFRQHIPDAVTLPQLFRKNGYFSAREGKMFHMGVPGGVGTPAWQDAASWDHSVSPQGEENRSQGEGRNLTPQIAGGVAMHWIATATPNGQADHSAAEHAIALLEAHQKDPFFLGLGFVRPHVPLVAPARFFDLYPLDRMKVPETPTNDLDDIPDASKLVRPQVWNHMGMDEQGRREALRAYFASTSFMDDQFGRVLGALERLKLSDNTIVVFWGDHGWHLGEHTRWQKMSLMEESARVPLIISAPGSKAKGRAARGLVEFVDLYPTLAELSGLKPPENLEGQSLVPLLNDPRRSWKKAAFTQMQSGDRVTGHSVRTEHHRYIMWEGEGGGEELYDHRSDPQEFTNLAKSPQSSSVLAAMRSTLKAGWREARAKT